MAPRLPSNRATTHRRRRRAARNPGACAGNPASRHCAARLRVRSTRDRCGGQRGRARSGPEGDHRGGQGLAAGRHAVPAALAGAHVADGPVDEERGHPELLLDARARVAHDITGELEVLPSERGAVNRVVPHHRHRALVRPHHLEHAELRIDRLPHAAVGEPGHLAPPGADDGRALAALGLSRRSSIALKMRPRTRGDSRSSARMPNRLDWAKAPGPEWVWEAAAITAA